MDEKWFGFSFILMALVGVGIWVSQQGCTESAPAIGIFLPTAIPTLPPDFVANFGGGTLVVNPNLCESQGGTVVGNANYGTSSVAFFGITANPNVSGVDSSPDALHYSGSVTDSNAYPALVWDIALGSAASPTINVSSTGCNFTGIELTVNVMSDDTCKQRLFGIGSKDTVDGQPGGTCTPSTNCNNDFWNAGPSDYTGSTYTSTKDDFGDNVGAGWKTYSYTFSQMNIEGGWGPATPTGSFASNVAEQQNTVLLTFKWSGNDLAAGQALVADYYVGSIQFLP